MLHATFKGFLSLYTNILHKYSCRKSTITVGIHFAMKTLFFLTWIGKHTRQHNLQVQETENSVSLFVGLEDFKITAMNIYSLCLFTLNGTICELHLRMCSICIVGVYYGVPLRSKYPDSEMLFQKQKISRDVQNMMPKIITYRSIPKKKKYVHRVPVY